MQLHLIRTAWPFSYAGVGAFNLIRADIYHKLGGHTEIAMDVLDDVKIGKLVKKNGGRQDSGLPRNCCRFDGSRPNWGVIAGLEKKRIRCIGLLQTSAGSDDDRVSHDMISHTSLQRSCLVKQHRDS